MSRVDWSARAAKSDDLRRALQALGCVDAALVMLPLVSLTAEQPIDEACGWTAHWLDMHSAMALALLWVSLVATAAQLIALSAARMARRPIFVRQLWWHLPVSLLGTCAGGALGVQALGGHWALWRGECGAEFQGVMAGAVVAGYILTAVYTCLARAEARATPCAVGPAALPVVVPPTVALAGVQPVALICEGDVSFEQPLLRDKSPLALSNVFFVGAKTASASVVLGKLAPGCNVASLSCSRTHLSPSCSSARSCCAGGDVDTSLWAVVADNVLTDRDVASIAAVIRSGSLSPNLAGMASTSNFACMTISDHNFRNSSIKSISTWTSNAVKPNSNGDLVGPASCDSRIAANMPTVSIFGSALPSSPKEADRAKSGGRPVSSRSLPDGGDGEHKRSRRSSKEKRLSIEIRQSLGVPKCPMSTMPTTPNITGELLQDEDVTAMSLFEDTLRQWRKSLNLMSASQEDPESRRSIDKESFEKRESHFSLLSTAVTLQTEVRRSGTASRGADTSLAFFSDISPINFNNLQPNASDSDVEEESDCYSGLSSSMEGVSPRKTKSDDVWQSPTQSTVEVPIWLLKKLKAHGWEPTAPANAHAKTHLLRKGVPKSRSGSPDAFGGRLGRFLGSCPMERPISLDIVGLDEDAEGKTSRTSMPKSLQPIDLPTGTFWKTSMPTQKITTLIQTSKLEGALSGESSDEEEGKADAIVALEDLPAGLTQDAASVEEDRVGSSMRPEATGQHGGVPTFRMWPCTLQPNENPESGCSQRVSFMDQQLGPPTEKWSECKKPRRCLNPVSGNGGDKDIVVHMLPKPVSRPGRRRPSILGVFSDDSAKAPGLYMLPMMEQNASELVEVRSSSLVMSASMLTDILKSKAESAHMENISEQYEADDNNDNEVVLPFFSSTTKMQKCQCKTDMVTGNVMHTCMTLLTMQATKTEAMQPIGCAECGSMQNFVVARRGAKSCRNSGLTTEEEHEDQDEDMPQMRLQETIQATHDRTVAWRRIRNTPRLQVVSTSAPKLFTRYKREEEPQVEKELAIPFTIIVDGWSAEQHAMGTRADVLPKASCVRNGRNVQDLGLSVGHVRSIEPPSEFEDETREEKVESELGHRFELIEPYILAAMLKNPDTRENVLTVDVRGRDWVGGHIPSSVNLRTSEVTSHPQALLWQCQQNRIHHIVFTCMYSVLRARKCAVALEKAQEDELKAAGSSTYWIRISLLAGGMQAWVNHFVKTQGDKPPKEFVEHFDADMWSDGGPSQDGLVHVMDALWSSGGQKALSDALSQELEQLLARRTSGEMCGSERQSSQSQAHLLPAQEPRKSPSVVVPPAGVGGGARRGSPGPSDSDAGQSDTDSDNSSWCEGNFLEDPPGLPLRRPSLCSVGGQPRRSRRPRKESFDKSDGEEISAGCVVDGTVTPASSFAGSLAAAQDASPGTECRWQLQPTAELRVGAPSKIA